MVARSDKHFPEGVRSVKEITAVQFAPEHPEFAVSIPLFEAVKKATQDDMEKEGRNVANEQLMLAGNVKRRLEMLTTAFAMQALLPIEQNEDGSFSGLLTNAVCNEIGKSRLGCEVWACLNTDGGVTLFLSSEWDAMQIIES